MSKSFHDIIESEVKQIASILLNLDEKNLRFGLYEGISGISLFMYLYYKHTNNILYKRKLDKLLKQSIKSIENSKSEGLFSVGLTGWGWLIIYLENESFLEQSNSLLETIDELLHRELIRLIEQREYDLLNGALGIGLYFLKRKKPEYIEILISFFERFIDNDLLKIKRRMHRTNEDVIDFGLAHGYAGIVYFFSKCIKEKKQVVRSQKVIKATIDFMLKNIQDLRVHNSYLPHLKWNDNKISKESRIAWCYGDLGVFFTLYDANVLLNNQELINLSLSALTHSSKKRDNKECMIFDSGFCHGSSGAAYLFYKMYLKTNNQFLKQASDTWLKTTLLFANVNSNVLNRYMFFNPNIDGTNKYESSYSLLDGVTGVGLVYLSLLNPSLND